jgi:hypothetical protein
LRDEDYHTFSGRIKGAVGPFRMGSLKRSHVVATSEGDPIECR